MRAADDVDAARKRDVAFPAAEALACLVNGDERRGTGGIDGHARSAQVEVIGKPVGRDAEGNAGPAVSVHQSLGVAPAELIEGEIRRGNSDEHAGLRALQPIRRHAGMLQSMPGHFEQDALLRVHGAGFAL